MRTLQASLARTPIFIDAVLAPGDSAPPNPRK